MTLIVDPNTDDSLNGWILTPAINLATFIADGLILAAITQQALQAFSAFPSLVYATKLTIPESKPDALSALEELEKITAENSNFAKDEEEKEFSTIFSHHLISVWAAIETTIEQTLINHLINVDDARERVQNFGVNLKRIKKISTRQHAKQVIRIWNSQLDESNVVERALIKLLVFNLTIDLGTREKQLLTEMCAARNIYAHNGGFVDEDFLEKCTWLNYQKGEKFILNYELMEDYFDAASQLAGKLTETATKSAFFRQA